MCLSVGDHQTRVLRTRLFPRPTNQRKRRKNMGRPSQQGRLWQHRLRFCFPVLTFISLYIRDEECQNTSLEYD